ncbi:multidrug/hemolysin transport system permease protein [Terribacillus aidingensis]|uniref:Multidrug/hemolysin transport system permease protein n=1 Tax=Terribacillus aidingensis TaxID=586416 RepID=A0A285P7N5_9BACI|nr:ABC transporter permease [Terribacillus aidingensis]SNZ17458.1 multidrug/hemolysin transport system permease protein [Terribacillus aidingensis]
MQTIWQLTKRSNRLFFRDKTAVFMSLFTIGIIIVLYLLFLADVTTEAAQEAATGSSGMKALIQSWLLAGIIVVISLTVTLSVLGTMIEDAAGNQLHALLITPITRTQLVVGYLLSAWFIAVLFSVGSLFLAQGYFWLTDKPTVAWDGLLIAIGLIMLITFSSAAFLFVLLAPIKSRKSFSSLGTIVGTLSGFLLGIYIPIGQLPSFVQEITKFFPPTYGVAALRDVLMTPSMTDTFADAPAAALDTFKDTFGVHITLFESTVQLPVILGILLLTGSLFLSLGVWLRSARM